MSNASLTTMINSMNPQLFSMCVSRLPEHSTIVKLENMAIGDVFYHVLSHEGSDWVMNIDEDAFLVREESIHSLLSYMKKEGYDYCGMPDGGACWHRKRNPAVINPFFFLFNVAALRGKLPAKHELPGLCRVGETITAPPYGGVSEYPDTEPYYDLFLWAARNARCLYLQAQDHPDGWSTILLDHEGKPFIKHSWYARCFSTDPYHNQRIINLFNEPA